MSLSAMYLRISPGTCCSSSFSVHSQFSRKLPWGFSSWIMSYLVRYVWLWQAMKSALLT